MLERLHQQAVREAKRLMQRQEIVERAVFDLQLASTSERKARLRPEDVQMGVPRTAR